MSSATWKAQASLSQLAPSALTQSLAGLDSAMNTATQIVQAVERIIHLAEGFLTTPGDLLVAFLQNYSSALFQVVADSLSIGGGMIFIHPYNRMSRRIEDILPVPIMDPNNTDKILFPMKVPVMTPQEALNEFYASFNNTADPLRPQWTTNTEVTGFGLLFIAPSPMGLVSFMKSLAPIFNFPEIGNLISGYTGDVNNWYTSTTAQIGTDAKHFLDFDITGVDFVSTETFEKDGTVNVEVLQIFDETLPELHWMGLSLENFTFLSNLEKFAKDLVGVLVKLTKTTNSFVKEVGDALIRKLEQILSLLKSTIELAQGFLVSLNATGVYYFEIPSGFGGVDYIRSAIQSSLSNPQTADASAVASRLNSSKFSALFFAGAGYGEDLNAWNALFKNAFDATNFVYNSLLDVQYSILPNFDQATFHFGDSIQLRVVSQNSTASNQLYYDYTIVDNKGKLVSSFTNKYTLNDAKVNQDTFVVTFPIPDGYTTPVGSLKYTLHLEVFNLGMVSKSSTLDFYVTDAITDINTRITINDPASVTLTDGSGGATLALINTQSPAGGYPLEKNYIASGGKGTLGSGVTPGMTGLAMSITTPDGSTMMIPLQNETGYRLGQVDSLPIPGGFRFLSYPAKICLNFEGVLRYRKVGALEWLTVTLPACFSVDDLTTYEYYTYTPATGWGLLGNFRTVTQTSVGTQVC